MHDVLLHLGQGFLTVFQPVNLFVLMIGLVLGLLVAVLPGLTLVMGVVLALPFTYKMGITPAVILLTAMYVTGTYGGAFTAILFRIPGEPIDVPLLWDGYEMAKKRRAGQGAGLDPVCGAGRRPGGGRRDGGRCRSRWRRSRSRSRRPSTSRSCCSGWRASSASAAARRSTPSSRCSSAC